MDVIISNEIFNHIQLSSILEDWIIFDGIQGGSLAKIGSNHKSQYERIWEED